MSDIERKRMTGSVCVNGTDYAFDAVLFRRAYYGALGRIGETAWQFGNYSTLRTAPAVAEQSRAELEDEITRRANSVGESSAAEHP